MLPLRLCWACTICKAQGQTIEDKVSLYLCRGEKEHGLSYIALSRVTRFSDIDLYKGIPYNHICKSIVDHKRMILRINAERRFINLFTLSFFDSGHRYQIACLLLGGFPKPRTAATQSLDSFLI